jgi:hypothetical protein
MRASLGTLQASLADAQVPAREEHAHALTTVRQVHDVARESGDDATALRALSLEGKLLLARGVVDGACLLATQVDAMPVTDPTADAAAAAFHGQLAFHLGGYRDAIVHATKAAVHTVVRPVGVLPDIEAERVLRDGPPGRRAG